MRITLCGCTIFVAKKSANDWQACATGNCETREAVAKIMNADVFKSGIFTQDAP